MIIKKLNGMFHKHGRWLFAVITVIIIISFVGFLSPGQFGFEGFGGGRAVGTAFGRKVAFEDLRQQSRLTQIFQIFCSGQCDQNLTPVQLFSNYCLMEAARRQGIIVTDKEVVAVIENLPQLMTAGKFDVQKYRNYFKFLHDSYGFTDGDVTEAIRCAMMLQKLQANLVNGIVVTPDEAESLYRSQNATLKIQAAVFESSAFAKNFKLDAKKLKTYFEQHRSAYQIAARASGIVAEFPFENYRSVVEKNLTPAEVEKYFADHRQDFADKAGKVPEYKTIAAKVRAAALKGKMRDYAGETAYAFSDTVYNLLSETPVKARPAALRKLLAQKKVAHFETGMVEAGTGTIAKKPMPGMAAQLNEAAQGANPVTQVLTTDKAAVVGFVLASIPARPAKFNEVSAKVTADFRQTELLQAARNAARDAAQKLNKVKEPAARIKAMAALKSCSVRTFEFSGNSNPPAGLEIPAYSAISLKNGEISQAIPTEKGAVLVQLLKRNPADAKKFAAVSVQHEMKCLFEKQDIAKNQFLEQLNKECRFNGEVFQR